MKYKIHKKNFFRRVYSLCKTKYVVAFLFLFSPISVTHAMLNRVPPSSCDSALGTPSATQIADVAVLYRYVGASIEYLAPVYALIDLGFAQSAQLTPGQTITIKGKICIPSLNEDFSSYSASPLLDPDSGFYGVSFSLQNISIPNLSGNAGSTVGLQTLSAYSQSNTNTPWVSDLAPLIFNVPASGKYNIRPKIYKVENSTNITGTDISINSTFFSGVPNMSIESSENGNPSNTFFPWLITGECTNRPPFGTTTGSGFSNTQTVLPAKPCTVTWRDRDGYTTPAAVTLTLSTSTLTRFVGEYVKISSSDLTAQPAGVTTHLDTITGNTGHLDATLENRGTIRVNSSFRSRLEIALKGDGSDVNPLVSTLTTNSAVEPGYAGRTILPFSFDPTSLSGTRYARVCVDIDNVVIETDESNNCSDWWPIEGLIKVTSNIGSDAAWSLTCRSNFTITHAIVGGVWVSSTAPAPGTTQGTLSVGGQGTFGYWSPGDCTITWFDVSKIKSDGTRLEATAPAPETKRLDSGKIIHFDGAYGTSNPIPPTLSTPTTNAITTSSATLGATVTSLGNPATISARGVCYGTTPNPSYPASGGVVCPTAVLSQTIPGVYTISVTGLTSGTVYHFRGFAVNATGVGYTSDTVLQTLGTCLNGANNPPTCTPGSCSVGKEWVPILNQCTTVCLSTQTRNAVGVCVDNPVCNPATEQLSPDGLSCIPKIIDMCTAAHPACDPGETIFSCPSQCKPKWWQF